MSYGWMSTADPEACAELAAQLPLDPARLRPPSSGYHCTIAYLGDSAFAHQNLIEGCMQFHNVFHDTSPSPQSVLVTHVAQWSTAPDEWCYVALLEGEWPHLWRKMLREHLPEGALDTQMAARFPFRPHVTLGYGNVDLWMSEEGERLDFGPEWLTLGPPQFSVSGSEAT